jgi:hypothetical protein
MSQIATMTEPMDVDGDAPRGTKRKADDLSVVTAARRIQVSLDTYILLLSPNLIKGS